jgi:ribonuclease P protein component
MVYTNEGFTKQQRLLSPKAYRYVFDHAKKLPNKQLLNVVCTNNLSHPRLGLIIAKKQVRKAVGRNLIKRVIRESFRHHQHNLPNLDIIVIARRGIEQLDKNRLFWLVNQGWLMLLNY